MNPNVHSPNARKTARKLLAHEAGIGKPSDVSIPAAIRVCEKLRRPLSTLAGTTGFRALLGRALTLAKAQDPHLTGTRVQPDGSLVGLSELRNKEEDGPAGLALIAQLLGLLDAFIGQDLTLRLVADVWPDLRAVEAGADGESGNEPTK
jgi:hypothetical protein